MQVASFFGGIPRYYLDKVGRLLGMSLLDLIDGAFPLFPASLYLKIAILSYLFDSAGRLTENHQDEQYKEDQYNVLVINSKTAVFVFNCESTSVMNSMTR